MLVVASVVNEYNDFEGEITRIYAHVRFDSSKKACASYNWNTKVLQVFSLSHHNFYDVPICLLTQFEDGSIESNEIDDTQEFYNVAFWKQIIEEQTTQFGSEKLYKHTINERKVHPGEVIIQLCREQKKSLLQLFKITTIPVQRLQQITSETVDLTQDDCTKLARFFSTHWFWRNLQDKYDQMEKQA